MLTPFLALEPRVMTRWDAHKFARDAYNAGIRYIGGCCGIEPYHIRAVAEEVTLISLLLKAQVFSELNTCMLLTAVWVVHNNLRSIKINIFLFCPRQIEIKLF